MNAGGSSFEPLDPSKKCRNHLPVIAANTLNGSAEHPSFSGINQKSPSTTTPQNGFKSPRFHHQEHKALILKALCSGPPALMGRCDTEVSHSCGASSGAQHETIPLLSDHQSARHVLLPCSHSSSTARPFQRAARNQAHPENRQPTLGPKTGPPVCCPV